MDSRSVGLAIVVLGLFAVLVGGAVWLGLFSWFGHLPGDIRVEKPNLRFYLPITSMLLLSLVLTLAVNLVKRLF